MLAEEGADSYFRESSFSCFNTRGIIIAAYKVSMAPISKQITQYFNPKYMKTAAATINKPPRTCMLNNRLPRKCFPG